MKQPTPPAPVTLKSIRALSREGHPFACLTCYDATFARILAEAGVHVLLVGDSAAETVLGFSRTIDMPLDVLLALTAAVKRGAPGVLVMGDMPFMSYQADDAEAVRNAGRFLTQGRADVVKLEVDASFAPLVEKITRAGIPVCAHIGSRPQRSMMTSGYAGAGRTPEDADAILADAIALERAGAVMLLIEAVPHELTRRVLAATSVPLIGIGAGPDCHGQVLVLHDVLGLSPASPPFARRIADVATITRDAAKEFVRLVGERGLSGVPGQASQPGFARPHAAVANPTPSPGVEYKATPRAGGA